MPSSEPEQQPAARTGVSFRAFPAPGWPTSAGELGGGPSGAHNRLSWPPAEGLPWHVGQPGQASQTGRPIQSARAGHAVVADSINSQLLTAAGKTGRRAGRVNAGVGWAFCRRMVPGTCNVGSYGIATRARENERRCDGSQGITRSR